MKSQIARMIGIARKEAGRIVLIDVSGGTHYKLYATSGPCRRQCLAV